MQQLSNSSRVNDFSILPVPDGFHTMHVSISNDDNIWGVGAPMFELDWTVEEEFFVPEGPTVDADGNLYFCPLNPTEDVSLVSIDGETGARRWSLPGRGPGHGAPLILNDPNCQQKPGDLKCPQIVYHATFTDAYAIKTTGDIVWHVKTGMEPRLKGDGTKHTWGLNWHRPTDSVVGITIEGGLFAFSRTTGERTASGGQFLPCAPAKPSGDAKPRKLVQMMGNYQTDHKFGQLQTGESVFEVILETIFGGGNCVTNFFSIDPVSGDILVVATADDLHDGTADGLAEDGALYKLQLANNRFEMVDAPVNFAGGSGATPSLTTDGKRVIVTDEAHHVIAVDVKEMRVEWEVDVGGQVAASVAVAHDNGEMYAVTKTEIVKVQETCKNLGTNCSATVAWRSDLSGAFQGDRVLNVNALTPTVLANGVAVSVAGVRKFGKTQVMYGVGIGLLDRQTGKLRWFAEGREESISVTGVAPDGSYYTGASPVRRAVATFILGDRVHQLTGGVSKYKVKRFDLLARDAVCAAAARVSNILTYTLSAPSRTVPAVLNSVQRDLLQVEVLVNQAHKALASAVEENSSPVTAATLHHLLPKLKTASALLKASPDSLETSDLLSALGGVCSFL